MIPRVPILVASAAAIVAARSAVLRVGRTWGASYAEAVESLPGDEYMPDPSSQVTMAVTIDAPPEAVWPWLVQMGVDRAGLYTHTWVENSLLHLKVKNADAVVSAWQTLAVGDHIWFVPEGYPTPRYGPLVVALEPNQALICTLGDDPAHSIGTWQFILRARGDATRLIFRSRSSGTRPMATKLVDLVLEPGYLYMDIGMLAGLKTRVETAARQTHQPATAPVVASGDKNITALVAVASSQGSTRQIAQTIARELRTKGIATDVRDVDDVSDLTMYDAVVLGSAIHTHHWLSEAQRFVERHSRELSTLPVWLFSSGMLAIDTKADWPADYPKDINEFLTKTGAREHRIFAGNREVPEPKFLWNLLSKPFSLLPNFHLTLGDYRDWDAMRDWADEIASTLQDHELDTRNKDLQAA